MSVPFSEATWAELGPRLPQTGKLIGRLVCPSPRLFLAIDHQGLRHILVALPGLDDAYTDDQSRGLLVSARQLLLNELPEQPFLDVCCTDRAANQMFTLVASDFHTRLASGLPTVQAVKDTLAKWRRFWGKPPGNRLSEEQIRGLFGELWFLKVWLLPHAVEHLQHWDGPTGGRHDFRWSDKAVEVKATTAARHVHVIHGVEQMDKPQNGPLYLFSLRLRGEPTSGNTIVSLIDSLLVDLGDRPHLLDAFEIRLAQAGYSPYHANDYKTHSFRVMSERLYVVDRGFPAITPASFVDGIPKGVEAITYTVTLEGSDDLCIATEPSYTSSWSPI